MVEVSEALGGQAGGGLDGVCAGTSGCWRCAKPEYDKRAVEVSSALVIQPPPPLASRPIMPSTECYDSRTSVTDPGAVSQ